MSLQKPKIYIFKIGLLSYLNQTKLETKCFEVVTRTLLIITKIHEFTKTSETEYSSNKNDPESSLEYSNHTKLKGLNSELALLQSLFCQQFIYIKKSLQKINGLYQQNENTSTYINAPIKQKGNLEEESKMENRIIQSLVEHDNASFWQTKNQTMEIENTPSKNVIVSNLEETVSAHTILAGKLSVK